MPRATRERQISLAARQSSVVSIASRERQFSVPARPRQPSVPKASHERLILLAEDTTELQAWAHLFTAAAAVSSSAPLDAAASSASAGDEISPKPSIPTARCGSAARHGAPPHLPPPDVPTQGALPSLPDANAATVAAAVAAATVDAAALAAATLAATLRSVSVAAATVDAAALATATLASTLAATDLAADTADADAGAEWPVLECTSLVDEPSPSYPPPSLSPPPPPPPGGQNTQGAQEAVIAAIPASAPAPAPACGRGRGEGARPLGVRGRGGVPPMRMSATMSPDGNVGLTDNAFQERLGALLSGGPSPKGWPPADGAPDEGVAQVRHVAECIAWDCT